MARLKFDQVGEKRFEAGVSQVVLFMGTSADTKGVVWNGVTSISESPDGGDANDQYADNIKYLSLRGTVNQNGTIESIGYPEKFNAALGILGGDGIYAPGGSAMPFCLAYKTKVGDDVMGLEKGEKLHIVWNATASPSERSHETINESPEAPTFSFEYKTTPIPTAFASEDADKIKDKDGLKDLLKLNVISIMELDNTGPYKNAYKKVEDYIYGTDGALGAQDSKLPTPAKVINLIADNLD